MTTAATAFNRPAEPTNVHRMMPHDVEAEQGILGSMMIGGGAIIEEMRALLSEDAFYIPAHQIVFGGICGLQASGAPTDLITLTNALRDADMLEIVGGAAFVTSLFSFVPTAANVTYYAEIVREKWMLRKLITINTETTRRCFEEQEDPAGLLAEHQSNVIEIGQLTSTTETLRHCRDFVQPAVDEIKAIYYGRGKPIGLETGWPDLDRMTGGFQPPLTYYIAGRPAMGKSSTMEGIAEHLAIEQVEKGINVAVFSIEMTGRQLMKRTLCSRSDINLQRMRDGLLDKSAIPRIESEAEIVKKGNLWIDDTSDLSIFKFRARARHAVMKRKCQLIIIDYIQRMHSTSKRSQGNREQEINEIAQGISATAKELNIPIVVLAQLNRQNEYRGDKRPQLSDLRESGSIEQEARCVMLLHRPVYYCLTDGAKRAEARKLKIFHFEIEQNGQPVRNAQGEMVPVTDEEGEPLVDLAAFEQYAELIVAKQNEGPVGTVHLRFVKEYARFESVTTKLFSNNPEERQHSSQFPV